MNFFISPKHQSSAEREKKARVQTGHPGQGNSNGRNREGGREKARVEELAGGNGQNGDRVRRVSRSRIRGTDTYRDSRREDQSDSEELIMAGCGPPW